MASDIAISVEGLSKRYLVGHNDKADPNATLRDQIARNLRDLGRKTRDMARGRQIVQGDTVEEFWALRDVSFQIPRGARVGILGRNGAGKSTLLKLLSRITEPTSGRIQINGRVASLLEVGTGFHPELTGRENIFLNGAILGMSRREIDSKFDAIVAFAEIERFLDTPVKRYSSGMYVRLAFAVAAHLDPEILIIDEVLAVGDSDFQRKCLGKMDSISKDGRTILFVSHNLLAIQKLCNQAILLKSGRLHIQSTVDTVVDSYISIGSATDYISDDSNLGPKIREVRLLTPEPRIDRDIEILVKWHLPSAIPGLKVGLGINTLEGHRIFDTAPEDFKLTTPSGEGTHAAVVVIPGCTLAGRTYSVSCGIWRENSSIDHVTHAMNLIVATAPIQRYAHQSTYDGLISARTVWRIGSSCQDVSPHGATSMQHESC